MKNFKQLFYISSTETSNLIQLISFAAKQAVGEHISASLAGMTSIRGLGAEQRFLHAFDVQQDRATAAHYLHLAADRWFSLRVDLLGLILVLAVAVGSPLLVIYFGK